MRVWFWAHKLWFPLRCSTAAYVHLQPAGVGHFRSLKPTKSLPQNGRSDDSGPVHFQRFYSSIMATYGMAT
jgi:hypothetical protein